MCDVLSLLKCGQCLGIGHWVLFYWGLFKLRRLFIYNSCTSFDHLFWYINKKDKTIYFIKKILNYFIIKIMLAKNQNNICNIVSNRIVWKNNFHIAINQKFLNEYSALVLKSTDQYSLDRSALKDEILISISNINANIFRLTQFDTQLWVKNILEDL